MTITETDYLAHSFEVPWWRTFTALGRMLDTPDKWHEFEWSRLSAYRKLTAYMADLLIGSGVPYYFQREPNLRIHPTGGTAVPWHTDADFGHLEAEWNVWIPLTEIEHSTQQIWLSTEEGLRYPPFVKLGYALCFRGAVVEHGNQTNLAAERRSFDFRLLASPNYKDRGHQTVRYGVPLREPEYWRWHSD